MIRGKNSVKDLIESHNHTKIIGIELHLRSNNNPDYITLPRLLDSNLTNLYIYIYTYTRHPETPSKGTWLKKRYLFPSIAMFLARIYQLHSHLGFSKFLPRQLLRCRCARNCEHLGRWALMQTSWSLLQQATPVSTIRSSHPDDLPALGGKDGWLP